MCVRGIGRSGAKDEGTQTRVDPALKETNLARTGVAHALLWTACLVTYEVGMYGMAHGTGLVWGDR